MLNRIVIDAEREIGKISPMIYGFNIEHIHDQTGASLVYGAVFDEGSSQSDEHGFRKDVVKAARRIKVPILRWPGGNFASGYHWENGVGPREKRPRLYELAWKSEESNQFGTDEFIEFCRLIGAEPFITVNAGSGTAEEAAHWVEYANRKGNTYYAKLREKNGHREPYGVTYWSIGNEMWGDFQIGNLPAEEYAKKAKEYAKLMRRVDPEIKLTTVGHVLGMNPEWDLEVLKTLRDEIDYVSTHYYYFGVLSGTKEENYYRALACPIHSSKKLDLLKGTIEVSQFLGLPPHLAALSSLEEPKRKAMISYDEWNISGCHYLRDALAMARLLNVLQRKCRSVAISCLFPLVHLHAGLAEKGNIFHSPITVYKNDIVLEAGYYAYDLFVNHTGEICVDARVQSETYTAKIKVPQFGREIEFKDVPHLDSSATLSKDGKRIYLSTVNAHIDQDLECQIELRGCSVKKAGKVYELNGHDIESFNDRDHKENVKITETSIKNLGSTFTYMFPAHSASVIEMEVG